MADDSGLGPLDPYALHGWAEPSGCEGWSRRDVLAHLVAIEEFAAFEYAIHANDVGAPIGSDEREQRQQWLVAVGRFAPTEVKDEVTIDGGTDAFTVRQGEVEATFDIDTFVAAVSARAAAETLTPAESELLSLGY